ncbi:MAG: hypothetical protein J6E48_00295 [Prevotella sp.]|nr:hypothetical protein [Prevotella sp.]
MKEINYIKNEKLNGVEANNKVDEKFVTAIQQAYRTFPRGSSMSFRQDPEGRLIIKLKIVHATGMKRIMEGYGDADLISTITSYAIGRFDVEYNAAEHEVETAVEGENLRFEIFKQYLASPLKGTIGPDWVSPSGKVYRMILYVLPHNLEVRFCLEASDEIDSLLENACTPKWLKANQEDQTEDSENN